MDTLNFSVTDIIKKKAFPVKVAPGSHPVTIRLADKVRRVRLVGLIFDDKKCFLLPKALDGIKAIIAMHRKCDKAEVLVIGHAGVEENGGADLALGRAEMLKAYLMSKPNEWLKWFAPDKDAKARWGVREIQLMLSVLPEGGTSFYSGNASGVSDESTITAIKKYQEHCNTDLGKIIAVNGKAGPETRIEMVQEYMKLSDTTLGEGIKVITHGCKGKIDTSVTESGLLPDSRRIEVLFYDQNVDPEPSGTTSGASDPGYEEWIKKIDENDDFENHGVYVQIVDEDKQPAKLATVFLKGPTTGKSTTDEYGFVSFYGLTAGEYTLLTEKKGVNIGTSTFTYPLSSTVEAYTV